MSSFYLPAIDPRDLHSFPTRRSSDLALAHVLYTMLCPADPGLCRRTLAVGHHGSGNCDGPRRARSEEHTSELQSRVELVCRLLLEKKNDRTDVYGTLRNWCIQLRSRR